MEGIKVLSYTRWYPFSFLGLKTPLWGVNSETILSTWIVLTVLLLVIIAARIALVSRVQEARYVVISFVRYFTQTVTQTLGFFDVTHFSFVTSLFIFIFFCNAINVFIPWAEEPTSDINTALALGTASFLYTQYAAIQAHGISGYLKEYLTPIFMFPLHITGKLATIISISFRLFGNIFGGAIITQIYNGVKGGSWAIETGLLLTGSNLFVALVFGIFEGLIQAFVFFMLSLTYLAVGIQSDEPEDHFA